MSKVVHILGLAAILWVQWLKTESGIFEAQVLERTSWVDRISAMEFIAPLCLSGLVIIIYFATKRITKGKKEQEK